MQRGGFGSILDIDPSGTERLTIALSDDGTDAMSSDAMVSLADHGFWTKAAGESAMLYLMSAIFIGMVVAAIALCKGSMAFLSWALGFCVLIAVIMVVLLLAVRTAAWRARNRKQDDDFAECSFCHETIRAEANVCWSCQRSAVPARSRT
jgi:hypothetical protein